MKRVVLLFVVLCVACSMHRAYGDQRVPVKLDNRDRLKEMIRVPGLSNIFIELRQIDENENSYGVTISVENISEGELLYLFDYPYNEKLLKDMLRITYDNKKFPGDKGKRIIEACEKIGESVFLRPSDNKIIITTSVTEGINTFRLPIYIAHYDEKNFIIIKKKKISLEEMNVIEVSVDFEIKPDEEYLRLVAAADSLVAEIGEQTFCSNKNHRGASLKVQYEKYNTKIDDLKQAINKELSARPGLQSIDKVHKDFMAIYHRLDSIDLEKLTVTSCDNDRKVVAKTHNCRYCSLTAEEIYNRLSDCYLDLHNGKRTKAQVMSEAEGLYNCAQKNNKRKKGNYMSRIAMYYNKIKSK